MIENLENEVWKDIIGYEGHYKISNLGRLISLKNNKEKLIKSNLNTQGYPQARLLKVGIKQKISRIHRLVAENFIENKLSLKQVNHINGIKSDNRLENLEWCDNSYNQLHAFKTGLQEPKNGIKNGMSKMTEQKVLEIRKLYPKYTQVQLGEMFGVHFSCIGYIVNRKTWKHI